MIDLFEARPTFLFACNEHAERLTKLIHVKGLIDDYWEGRTFADLPVVKGNSLPNNSVVINCTLASKGRIARRRIESFPCGDVYDYSEVLEERPDVIPPPPFIVQTVDDLKSNARQWEWIRDKLCDDRSRKVLSDVLHFRTTARLRSLADYRFDPHLQYFDDVMEFSGSEIFVDCGGFDGDTAENFIKRTPGYERIYLFEPSLSNLEKARTRLSRYPDIEFILAGLSDRPGFASFDSAKGSASTISEDGEDRITLSTVDQRVDRRVTFIKMDLEGWELMALNGARNHIHDDHPKMAIAVYHHPSDFWRIPAFVLGIRDDYDIHLRHYTEGWTETVMYFVPRVSAQQ